MIQDIRLQQFRSYEDASFEFGAGVNIIVGPNGSGKTNLLESLLVICVGGSYRVSDADLVQFDAGWSRLDARVDGAVIRTIKIIDGNPVKKTYEIDGRSFARLPYQRRLPVVLFEPNHLLVLQGAPDARRSYLDDMLEQLYPSYGVSRKNFRRVLAQRNALLKHPAVSKQDFFPWDLRLSELGAVIHRARAELVGDLNSVVTTLYKELSGSDSDVSLLYESRFASSGYESQLLHALEANRAKDIERGFTTLGPHREDMLVFFGGNPAQLVASRGEIRTVTLALKVLELEKIQTTIGVSPILLLDDVFSELDGARRRALTGYLQRYQTFLTTTDADVVVKHFTDSTIIPLR